MKVRNNLYRRLDVEVTQEGRKTPETTTTFKLTEKRVY